MRMEMRGSVFTVFTVFANSCGGLPFAALHFAFHENVFVCLGWRTATRELTSDCRVHAACIEISPSRGASALGPIPSGRGTIKRRCALSSFRQSAG